MLETHHNNDVVLEAQHVTKIYGRPKMIEKAKKLMNEGLNKKEIRDATGCIMAVCDASFKVKRGTIFVIIGLSGSGKSTIIRCFNNLVTPSYGHVLFEGHTINEFPKKELTEFRRKKISMVFQSFGLFTHRSVLRNVAYGLEVRGVPRQGREEKAKEYIDLVGLSGLESSLIGTLSGGMKQRVGLARALCNEPDVLLMDEPFSALDPLVRHNMQDELLEIQKKLGKTILFITHDIDEAFRLGDRLAIMRDGRIIQAGTPESLLTSPKDDYVKDFVKNSNRSAILTVGMIMRSAAVTAVIEDDESLKKAAKEALEQDISYVYLKDSQSKLKGVVPAKECMPGMKIASAPVAVDSNTTLTDVFTLATETPYPLPVISSNGVLLGIVSKSLLLKALK